MLRVLITGGSGFIGTNLVEYFLARNLSVINYDLKAPQNKEHLKCWIQGDILNKEDLTQVFKVHNPDYVVHLAARTDLEETQSLSGYSANIEGVRNVVNAVNGTPNIKRTIYASSRMVCKIDYVPKSFDDFCPPNLYGESKVQGEKIVKKEAEHDFVIIRPTSIWGPYFHIPYRTFFDTIQKKLFFLPKGHNPKKSFGFVYNSVYQIDKLLFEQERKLNQVYYLTDYPSLELRTWSNLISNKLHGTTVLEITPVILKCVSLTGDLLYKLGWKKVPLTTFRYTNLITNMEYDTKDLQNICGNLPYTLEEGVDITVSWIKNH